MMRPRYDSPAELAAFDAAPEAQAAVEEYFYTDGRECGDCNYCQSWTEPHGERCNSCDVVEGKFPASTCLAWEVKHIALDEEN